MSEEKQVEAKKLNKQAKSNTQIANEKQQEIKDLKAKTAQQCTKEFGELLIKHNCRAEIDMTISTTGKITARINILAN